MLEKIKNITKQKAQGIVEYALLLAFIVGIAMMLNGGDLGGAVKGVFEDVSILLGGEITAALHADVAGDLRNGKVGIFQHASRLFHHHQFPVTAGRHAGLLFELGEKPGPRHAAPAGKLIHGTILRSAQKFLGLQNMDIAGLDGARQMRPAILNGAVQQ